MLFYNSIMAKLCKIIKKLSQKVRHFIPSKKKKYLGHPNYDFTVTKNIILLIIERLSKHFRLSTKRLIVHCGPVS